MLGCQLSILDSDMKPLLHQRTLLISALLIVGCTQKPAPVDTAQQINAGVNILPAAVLAADKQTPSKLQSSGAEPDLIDVIEHSDEPSYKLIEVLRASGLIPMLQQVGPYTIFAPTDDAFDKLPPGVLDRLLLPSHHAELLTFVKYHLLKGRIDFTELLQTNGQVPTLAGPKIVIKGIGKKVMVEDANIIRTDTAASNGVVHWIDGVLIPPG
jgi:uncharacterized surface protein with fasciclin (FAS1) repeats